MKSSKSIIAIFSGIGILALIIALSFTHIYAKDRTEIFKELRDQMQNFKTTEVVPMLNKWKNQIDVAMSKEDLAKLNELRAKAYELHLKNIEQRRQCIRENQNAQCDGSGPKGNKGRKQGRRSGNGMCDPMSEIITELKPLSEKYISTLDEINPEFTMKKKEWKDITSEIFQNWREANKEDLKNFNSDRPGKGFRAGGNGMRMMDIGHRNGRQPFFVMLWNGVENNVDEGFFGLQGMTSINTVREDMATIKNYPNPFSDNTNIEFYLPDGQMTKLSIVDETGKVIKVLHDGFLNEGNHKFEFNPKLVNLKQGIYLYQIECDDFSKSGKMIYSK